MNREAVFEKRAVIWTERYGFVPAFFLGCENEVSMLDRFREARRTSRQEIEPCSSLSDVHPDFDGGFAPPAGVGSSAVPVLELECNLPYDKLATVHVREGALAGLSKMTPRPAAVIQVVG